MKFGTVVYRMNKDYTFCENRILKYENLPNMEEMTIEKRKFHKEGHFVCIS